MSAMPDDIPLGKSTDYVATYTPSLLRSIMRSDARRAVGLTENALPFRGVDTWNCYEFSWLNAKGKPEIAALRLQVPCTSKCLIESKSLKLYLNSFAQTRFDSPTEVRGTLTSDLSLGFRAAVLVELLDVTQIAPSNGHFPGVCLDDLDVSVRSYTCDPELLFLHESNTGVRETLFTNLFRSICPVTGQPDWASVMVQYAGRAIDQAGMLKYLISFRNHPGFHEDTVERVFIDVLERCRPDQLTVHARFSRRGGIDINPFRSTSEDWGREIRLPRQ